VQLLKQLVLGPFKAEPRLAEALLCVEAALVDDDEGHATEIAQRAAWNMDRAQAAAQAMLAVHRHSMPLWHAYACLLVAAKQYKVRARALHLAV
jgi:hypothetical protein